MQEHVLKKAFFSFKSLLNRQQKRQGKGLLFLACLISVADVVALATVVPVLMFAIDGDFLAKSRKLRWLYKTIGSSSEASFLITLIAIIALFFIIKNSMAIVLQIRI
jgi:hypothetical protein